MQKVASAMSAGALALGVPADEVAPLGRAGQGLGEAYQIGDDLLDARCGTGKTTGQDKRHQRPTHSLQDEHACLDQLTELVSDARSSLKSTYGARCAHLLTAVDAIFNAHLAEASQAA
jgi:geranylgeranyl pyrophosphate synthase